MAIFDSKQIQFTYKIIYYYNKIVILKHSLSQLHFLHGKALQLIALHFSLIIF